MRAQYSLEFLVLLACLFSAALLLVQAAHSATDGAGRKALSLSAMLDAQGKCLEADLFSTNGRNAVWGAKSKSGLSAGDAGIFATRGNLAQSQANCISRVGGAGGGNAIGVEKNPSEAS
ncbi:MAG: hypothetical protein WC792_05495 [Candidatus Micrarchaeia archaeon]|jgi:hypothetical protein